MLALLLAYALAADEAIQVHVLPGAVDFAETWAESLDPGFYYADVGAEYDCWDRVGISGFNLQIPIDTVDLALDEDVLTATIDFGTIYGAGMTVYGQDAQTFDTCPEFSLLLAYAQVIDARVVTSLELNRGFGGSFGGGTLSFRWAEPPVVEGTIETDFVGVPDSAILPFVEDQIRQAAVQALTDALPPLLEEFLGEATYAGDYGGLAASLALSDAALDAQALSLFVDLDVASSAVTPCEIGNPGTGPAPTGLRSARLPMDRAVGADIGVGLTEELMGQSLHAAWQSGWFCFESDTVDDLVAGLRLFIDPDVADLEAWATLDSPPTVVATQAGIQVTVPDVRMELTGVFDGSRVPVVVSRFDLTGTAVPGFDQSLTSMTLSMVDPTFDFHEITLRHVPTPALVEPLIEQEVEAWASDWARESLQDIVLFDALYYAWDVAMLLDHSEPRDGGLELYFALYDVDDPAVDTVPPDTTLTLVDQAKRGAELLADATDDRTEPLAFSWQVNGGGWSSWTTEPGLALDALPDGDYLVEVAARDVWLNVDPTPATVSFTVKGPASSEESGCGCASSRPAAAPWLLAFALAFRRR